MTQDEIIALAREAGGWDDFAIDIRLDYLERFAALVAEAKRKQTLCEAAAIVLMSPSREAAVDALQEMGA